MQNIMPEWSKSYIQRPRNNLKSHVFLDEKIKFKPSYESDGIPTCMNWLLGWEYARKWLKERDDFYKAREDRNKPKRIINDYWKWVEKRKPKEKFSCKPQGVNKLLSKNRKSSVNETK